MIFGNEVNGEVKKDNNINVTTMMQYILCLDTLNLSYDKSGKYKDWSILRYFRVYKSEDSQKKLETDKYIKIREDYEIQFEKEKQERENKELVPKLAVEVENKEEKITDTNEVLSADDIIKYMKFIRHQYNESLIKTNKVHHASLTKKLCQKRNNEVYNGKSIVEMYEKAARNNKVNSKKPFWEVRDEDEVDELLKMRALINMIPDGNCSVYAIMSQLYPQTYGG
jgi:hypothetical protein